MNPLDSMNETEQKIVARFVEYVETTDSALEALAATITDLVGEARGLGWPEATVSKMPAVVTHTIMRFTLDVVSEVAGEVLADEAEQFLTTTTEGK